MTIDRVVQAKYDKRVTRLVITVAQTKKYNKWCGVRKVEMGRRSVEKLNEHRKGESLSGYALMGINASNQT